MYQLWQEERPQPAKPKEDVDDLIFCTDAEQPVSDR